MTRACALRAQRKTHIYLPPPYPNIPTPYTPGLEGGPPRKLVAFFQARFFADVSVMICPVKSAEDEWGGVSGLMWKNFDLA